MVNTIVLSQLLESNSDFEQTVLNITLFLSLAV